MTRQSSAEILPAGRGKPEWSFYVGWIAVTFLCIPMALLLCIIILKIITFVVGDFVFVNGVRRITEDYLFMYVFVPSASILTGALQYGLLRQYMPHMGGWVLATFAGWLLGVLLIALPTWVGWIASPITDLHLALLMMGFGIGLTQWLVLRRALPQAGWWIAATILGWLLLGLVNPGNSFNQYGILTLGFVPACLTAAVLAIQINRLPDTKPGI